jgi:hypothetical protein
MLVRLFAIVMIVGCRADSEFEIRSELRRWIAKWDDHRRCIFPSPAYGPDRETTEVVARELRNNLYCGDFEFHPAVDMDEVPGWNEIDHVIRALPRFEPPDLELIDRLDTRVDELRARVGAPAAVRTRVTPSTLPVPVFMESHRDELRCEDQDVTWTRTAAKQLTRTTPTTRWTFPVFTEDRLHSCRGGTALLVGPLGLRRCRGTHCSVVHRDLRAPCAAGLLDDATWLAVCRADRNLIGVWGEDLEEPVFYRLPSEQFDFPMAVVMQGGSPYVLFDRGVAVRIPRFPTTNRGTP